MEPYERSALQRMNIMIRNEDQNKINSFPYMSKTHSTLKEKRFIPLFAGSAFFSNPCWLASHSHL